MLHKLFGKKSGCSLSNNGIQMINAAICEAVLSKSVGDLNDLIGPNCLKILDKYRILIELRLFKMFSWTYSLGLNRAQLPSHNAQLLVNRVTERLVGNGIFTNHELQEIKCLHGSKDDLIQLSCFPQLQNALATRYFEYSKIINSSPQISGFPLQQISMQVARNCDAPNQMAMSLYVGGYLAETYKRATQLVQMGLQVK